jgi:hypothetical protein
MSSYFYTTAEQYVPKPYIGTPGDPTPVTEPAVSLETLVSGIVIMIVASYCAFCLWHNFLAWRKERTALSKRDDPKLRIGENKMAALGIFGFIILIGVSILQMSVGYMGIEHHFSSVWAWSAIAVAFVFRIMLPLTIGTYFGAVDVLGWPWYAGLALAAPGLLFMVPAAITSVIATVFDKRQDEPTIIEHED